MEQIMALNSVTVNDRKDGYEGNDEAGLLRNKLAALTTETNQFTYIIKTGL